ncbi:MAG: hypothetical protein WC899_07350 [bacterium]
MTGSVQRTCLVALAAAILATIPIAGPVHAAAPLKEGKFLFAESVEAVGK